MYHETWISVKAREVIDRAAVPLRALVHGHYTGEWPALKGRTVMVNSQRLSVCIVERQVLWIWTESDGSVTIALMDEVSRENMQRGEHTN